MRLKDKVAIITGAGGAQGRTATIMFCQEGAKVVAVDWDQKNVEEMLSLTCVIYRKKSRLRTWSNSLSTLMANSMFFITTRPLIQQKDLALKSTSKS